MLEVFDKSALRSFSLVTVWLCNFFGAKGMRKMLMKLAIGVNFTNILRAAYLHKCVLHIFYNL